MLAFKCLDFLLQAKKLNVSIKILEKMFQKILIISILLIFVDSGETIPNPGLFPEGLFLEWAHRPSLRYWLASHPAANGGTGNFGYSAGRMTYG